MPGITLHYVLAKRVLDRWRSGWDAAPFDLDDASALNAFYQGSVGPDFGYLPGGHRPLSELAHTRHTGELTTRLIQSARTARERAFAWGWLSHVLGDREIHPWIGRGVGELTERDPEVFVSGAADPRSHLRVEMGVDGWYANRHPDARAVRVRPVFDEASIGFLRRAYARTYGTAPTQSQFLDSHLAAGRRAAQAVATLRLLHAILDQTPALALAWIRALVGAAQRGSATTGIWAAYLSPVKPRAWLLRGIEGAVDAHADLFMEIYRRGGVDIGDFDLDTGEALDAADPVRASERPEEVAA